MKINFEKISVPNFVRVKGIFQGIDIQYLTKSELNIYIAIWKKNLIDNYTKRKGADKK